MSDNLSFSQLFIDYQAKFVRFAASYVHDQSLAEDFTSDALIYYWENRHKLPSDTNIPAYILTSIKNKCLNHLQHIKVREKVNIELYTINQWELSMRIATLDALDPSEMYTSEILEIVNKTLSTLSETDRLIFRKSRFDGLSNKDIAKELNISVKTVEAHLTRTLKHIRSELKDYLSVCLLMLILDKFHFW
jgi:RNA polymerase sigma-70 factor (ECF subfamily)